MTNKKYFSHKTSVPYEMLKKHYQMFNQTSELRSYLSVSCMDPVG